MGKKTYWLFVLYNSKSAFIFLIAGILTAVLNASLNTGIVEILNYITAGAFIIFALSIIGSLFSAWLIYKNYTFSISDDAFRVNRGILNKEEIAIPYRQIQSVDLRQNVIGQMLGISKLAILTAGQDEDKNAESEADFPAIDTQTAKSIQAELLKRSETEKVVVEK